MKILVYGNRKQDDTFYDISTPEKEAAAFLALFQHLRDDWKVYEASELTKAQKPLYDAAEKGDAKAAKQLLTLRKKWEYEEWRIENVIDATVADEVQHV